VDNDLPSPEQKLVLVLLRFDRCSSIRRSEAGSLCCFSVYYSVEQRNEHNVLISIRAKKLAFVANKLQAKIWYKSGFISRCSQGRE
jgi:hypothetical protein